MLLFNSLKASFSPPAALNCTLCIQSLGRPIDRLRTLLRGWSPPLDPSKLIILIIFAPLWEHQALGDMLSIFVSKYLFRKRSEARDMTIFGSLLIEALSIGTFL